MMGEISHSLPEKIRAHVIGIIKRYHHNAWLYIVRYHLITHPIGRAEGYVGRILEFEQRL